MSKEAAAALGRKYGASMTDFSQASSNTLENVLMAHCNQGIDIMRKAIQKGTKVGGASTLAQSMENKPVKKPNSITVVTFTSSDYWQYVNYGVNGVRRNKGAVRSKDGVVYKFKNLYTPPKMVDSFMTWASRAKIRNVGKTTLSYRGKKRKTAIDEHRKAAQQLAVYTKIGGIKPLRFVEKANNPKRNKQLVEEIRASMTEVIKIQVKKF